MKGAAISYSAEELAWAKANKALPRREAHGQFCRRFGRHDVSLDNFKALCKRNGWFTGRTGQFDPGHVPDNKGRKMPFNANRAKTQFKKGHRGGRAAKQYKPIGTERVSRDGYVERKVHDGMPLQSRWRAVHLIRWEAENGPLPEDHCLKCLDCNKSNTNPANWECIPRAMLPRLNGRFGRGYDQAPAELKPVILTAAKLEHKVRTIREES